MGKLLILTASFSLLMFANACQRQLMPDARAADEAALRKADEDWSKAAGAKDVERTISYYADDASVMPPNGALTTSKEAIRKIWKDFLTAPGFSGGWKSIKVEVARSGEIGYATGTWEFTLNDANGKPVTDRGKYTEVWKKQSDGNWKCAVDIWNSDSP